MPQGYETGMKVTYDKLSRRVVIAFRGRITVLPGLFDNETAGIAEGEAYCRRHGWSPLEPVRTHRQLRSAW